jgi:RHS repeat-associated protein
VVNTYSYEPYGKTASSTGTTVNPWRFGGSYGAYAENNASGLLKIGQRFYDPSLGRWTQQDPLSSGDRYAYASDNPTNLTDPSGALSLPNVHLPGGDWPPCGPDNAGAVPDRRGPRFPMRRV